MFGDRRRLVFKEEARAQLQKGINILADAVETTLGPSGGNVILERVYNTSIVTKDGVSVARDLFLEHPVENIGAQMIKQAAEKTAEDAGDGTSTSTILARDIYNRALRLIEQGYKAIEIKQGVEEAVKQLAVLLKENAHPIKDLEDLINIAVISANGDVELGKTIAEAVYEIGEDGTVLIEESKNEVTYSEIIKGTVIERGFISQHFATSGEQEVTLDNPIILVTNTKCTNPGDLESFFKYVHENNLSFLLIMEELDKMALAYAIENINKGLLKGAIITPPGVSNMRQFMLEDLAIITGGKFVDRFKNHSLANVQLGHFGKAEKVIVSRKKTVILGGKGETAKIEERIKSIEKNIQDSEKNIDTRHKDRLAKMFAGVSTIYVGGVTEIERKERYDRVDDARRATQAALAEGFIIGGGTALYKLSSQIKPLENFSSSQLEGFKLIQESIKTPFRTIVSNTGKSVEVVENELLNFDKKLNIKSGYNARTGTMSKDLAKDGIIDPVKVTRTALENAASVAALLFTTECVVYYKDNQHEPLQMDAGNIR